MANMPDSRPASRITANVSAKRSTATRFLRVSKNKADFVSLTEEHSLLRFAGIDTSFLELDADHAPAGLAWCEPPMASRKKD
jgi:hypothetical protein